MKPYYTDDSVTLYHGDYRDVLPSLGQFDAIVTDPPYGDTSLAWDRSPARGWLRNVRPHLSPSASVWFFASLRYTLALADEIRGDWQFAQDVIWEKHNGSSFHADRFRRVHESAVHLYPSGVAWSAIYKDPRFTMDATKRVTRRKGHPAHTGSIGPSRYASEDGGPRLQRSVIQARSEHGRAINPTQKPEAIVAPLVEYSCPVGGIVLDIFAGSCTTLAVCKQRNRRAVGIEKREAQCEKAAHRLSQDILNIGGVA